MALEDNPQQNLGGQVCSAVEFGTISDDALRDHLATLGLGAVCGAGSRLAGEWSACGSTGALSFDLLSPRGSYLVRSPCC